MSKTRSHFGDDPRDSREDSRIEVAPRESSCALGPNPFNMGCVTDIIADFRAGAIVNTTIRKLLKTVDSGLAMFENRPAPIFEFSIRAEVQADTQTDPICDRLEALLLQPGILNDGRAIPPEIWMLLWQLLQIALKKWMK